MHPIQHGSSQPAVDPLAWKPEDDMVVTINSMGAGGVYLNGKHILRGGAGMLCHGDELVLFRDKERGERLGFMVELRRGLVRREDRGRFVGIKVGGVVVANLEETFGEK